MADGHVSLAYEAAVIKLYAAFERMIVEALTGAINNDTSQLSATTHVQFPKHLTDEVCEYLISGSGYFSFRGRDGLIKEIKKYVGDSHYLLIAVKDQQFKTALEQLCALRNYAAHNSKVSKQIVLKLIGQEKIGSAGSWLKVQKRFVGLVECLRRLSCGIESGAPY